MAVGLGKIFGFEFLENFNYPYFAASVSDFWRRWHISLGTFFREYVYIPLGGNKRGKWKTVRNLFIVWVLTGLWHGANWTFILWGIIHFLAIVLEKLFIRKQKNAFIGHLYVLGVVITGWVFFRSDSIEMAIKYIKIMMGIGVNGYVNIHSIVLLKENFIFLIVGILGTVPVMSVIKKKIGNSIVYEILEQLWVPILFYFCCCYLIKSTYNPFIYFNF